MDVVEQDESENTAAVPAASPQPGAPGSDAGVANASGSQDGGVEEGVPGNDPEDASGETAATPSGDVAEPEGSATVPSGGAVMEGLPDEYNQTNSAVEGMRVLQCIEWLRDRIIDSKFGDEETEMVRGPAVPNRFAAECMRSGICNVELNLKAIRE